MLGLTNKNIYGMVSSRTNIGFSKEKQENF